MRFNQRMTLLLKQIFGLFKLLNSDKGAKSIAAGISLGMILGFTPAFSLQTLLVILILFFFRVQIGAAFLAAFFFKIPAWLLDPVFDQAGQIMLELPSLQPVYTSLFQMPIVPFTRFNNSIVMGSGVIALMLAPFMYFAALKGIEKYRTQFVARFEQSKLWKAWSATSFYQLYLKYEQGKSFFT